VSALLISARCVLAAVFGMAALGKLLDLDGSRRALEEFGLPRRVARLGGAVLPLAELVVAVLLLIRPTARAGAAAAAILLLAFIGGVARAMASGRAPDCHCFGQIHSEPAGVPTLIRNAALAAVAIVIVVAGPGPSVESLDRIQAALAVSAALAAVFALAVAALWGDRRRLERDLDALRSARARPGLPSGAEAPEFALTPIRGAAPSLADLRRARRPTVLVFVSTNCGPCLELLPMLARWRESLEGVVTLATIFAGDRPEVERLCEAHDLAALAQRDNETFELYELRATPSAVLIDLDGTVAGAPAEGVAAIEALVRVATAEVRETELTVHRA
jgi:uncharacterized membrane protein YphA (DoxX/SURF4 family)/thiol-disulfide isomerase/thioredoxin